MSGVLLDLSSQCCQRRIPCLLGFEWVSTSRAIRRATQKTEIANRIDNDRQVIVFGVRAQICLPPFIERLRNRIGDLEQLAAERKQRLTPELDSFARGWQMQRAYGEFGKASTAP